MWHNLRMTESSVESESEGTIHVLLIEDDQRLARLTASYLQMRGLVVTLASDGPIGLHQALAHRFDVILLDLMLPGKDGIQVCRELRRRSDVPIIMVTALGEEGEVVVGLEAGADDYIAKPFSSPDLLARLQAAVRRARGKTGPSTQSLQVGRLTIEPEAMEASLEGQILDLTAYEFAILHVLAQRAGRILSREQLLDLAKGRAEEAFERSVDGHISRLRRKLGDNPRDPRILKTVRGVGYLLAKGEDA